MIVVPALDAAIMITAGNYISFRFGEPFWKKPSAPWTSLHAGTDPGKEVAEC